MPMKNPPHVGGLIRREVIEPLGLTVTKAAKVLHDGRQALSALLNERVALSRDMALRVEKAFGPKMEHLMRMQLAYDLAQARREEKSIAVKRYVAEERATRSLSKAESACLPTCSTLAASVTLNPSGSITSRRISPPTCGGFFIGMIGNTSLSGSQPGQDPTRRLPQTERSRASCR